MADSQVALMAAGIGAAVVVIGQFFLPHLLKLRPSNNCNDKKHCRLHGERLAAVEAFVKECRDRLGRIENKIDRMS